MTSHSTSLEETKAIAGVCGTDKGTERDMVSVHHADAIRRAVYKHPHCFQLIFKAAVAGAATALANKIVEHLVTRSRGSEGSQDSNEPKQGTHTAVQIDSVSEGVKSKQDPSDSRCPTSSQQEPRTVSPRTGSSKLSSLLHPPAYKAALTAIEWMLRLRPSVRQEGVGKESKSSQTNTATSVDEGTDPIVVESDTVASPAPPAEYSTGMHPLVAPTHLELHQPYSYADPMAAYEVFSSPRSLPGTPSGSMHSLHDTSLLRSGGTKARIRRQLQETKSAYARFASERAMLSSLRALYDAVKKFANIPDTPAEADPVESDAGSAESDLSEDSDALSDTEQSGPGTAGKEPKKPKRRSHHQQPIDSSHFIAFFEHLKLAPSSHAAILTALGLIDVGQEEDAEPAQEVSAAGTGTGTGTGTPEPGQSPQASPVEAKAMEQERGHIESARDSSEPAAAESQYQDPSNPPNNVPPQQPLELTPSQSPTSASSSTSTNAPNVRPATASASRPVSSVPRAKTLRAINRNQSFTLHDFQAAFDPRMRTLILSKQGLADGMDGTEGGDSNPSLDTLRAHPINSIHIAPPVLQHNRSGNHDTSKAEGQAEEGAEGATAPAAGEQVALENQSATTDGPVAFVTPPLRPRSHLYAHPESAGEEDRQLQSPEENRKGSRIEPSDTVSFTPNRAAHLKALAIPHSPLDFKPEPSSTTSEQGRTASLQFRPRGSNPCLLQTPKVANLQIPSMSSPSSSSTRFAAGVVSKVNAFTLNNANSPVTDPIAPRVFLGGVCGSTVWRQDVAIPLFEEANVTYYNPQVSRWIEPLVPLETLMKAWCPTLLFVIDGSTRAVASLVEASNLISEGRQVVLVLENVPKDAVIDGHRVSERECQDLNRGRAYLAEVARTHRVPVFNNVAAACQYIIDLTKQERV